MQSVVPRRLVLLIAVITPVASVQQSLAAFMPSMPQDSAATPAADPSQIVIRVQDQTAAPVAGATVQLQCQTASDEVDEWFETDEAGVAIVPLPAALASLKINVYATGFIPRMWFWNSDDEIPAEQTFTLIPGTEIGGIVTNRQGEPVEGAKIVLTFSTPMSSLVQDIPKQWAVYEFSWQVPLQFSPTTDSQGRWKYRSAPPEDTASVEVSHPAFLPLLAWNRTSSDQIPAPDELRDGTAKFVLRDGIRLAGVVRAADGQPIANSNLWLLPEEEVGQGTVTTHGDEQGRFLFPAVLPGGYQIACCAEGFAPTMLPVGVSGQAKPIEITLLQGRPIKIHVFDPDGRPIRADVVLVSCGDESWSFTRSSPPKPSLPAATDATGLYAWNSAPTSRLGFSVVTKKFKRAFVAIPAGEDFAEQTVRLEHMPALVGRVIDKSTQQPIEHFTVVPFQSGGLNRGLAVRGKDGGFELPFPDVGAASREFKLFIEHEGHRMLLTDQSFSEASAAKDLVIELEPAAPVSGTIVGADGKPITQAIVSIGERPREGEHTMAWTSARSNETGQFTFAAPPADFRVSVIIPDGYIDQNFRSTDQDLGKLKLTKWGQVSGRVVDEQGRPVHRVRVFVHSPSVPYGENQQECITEKDGQFHFEKIRAGPLIVFVTRPNVSGKQVHKAFELAEGDHLEVEMVFNASD